MPKQSLKTIGQCYQRAGATSLRLHWSKCRVQQGQRGKAIEILRHSSPQGRSQTRELASLAPAPPRPSFWLSLSMHANTSHLHFDGKHQQRSTGRVTTSIQLSVQCSLHANAGPHRLTRSAKSPAAGPVHELCVQSRTFCRMRLPCVSLPGGRGPLHDSDGPSARGQTRHTTSDLSACRGSATGPYYPKLC